MRRIATLLCLLCIPLLLGTGWLWWQSYKGGDYFVFSNTIIQSTDGRILIWLGSPPDSKLLPAASPIPSTYFKFSFHDGPVFLSMEFPWALLAGLFIGFPAVLGMKRWIDRWPAKVFPERPCIRCGYDLCSTPLESPCPECGLAAHRSLPHVDPSDCPPKWVYSIAWGSRLLLISYVLFGMTMASAFWIHFDNDDSLAIVLLSILAISMALHAIANVLLSRDERRRPFTWLSFLFRWSLRVVPAVPVAGSSLALLNAYWLTAMIGNLPNMLALPLLVCPALSFFRLRVLALRLSRPRLAEHILIVAVGSSASVIYVVVGFAVSEFRHADIGFYLLNVLPLAMVILFAFWSMLLLFLITPRFFRSAKTAKLKWIVADAARDTRALA